MTQTTTAVEAATEKLTAPGAPFECERVTIHGVEQWVFAHAPSSLRDVLLAGEQHGDAEALVYEDERWTHRDVHAAAAALAHQLAERFGVVKGERVAIAMRNYPEYVPSFWAVVSSGALAVPLNAWWTADELEYGLTHSGATVLICDEERLERLADRLDDLDLTVVCVRAASPLPDGVHDVGELLDAAPEGVGLPEVELHPDDDATIMYTSGTTGRPKGAVASHRAAITTLMNGGFYQARNAILAGRDPDAPREEQPVQLVTFPFFHVAGLQSALIPATAGGVKMVLMYRWDPDKAAGLVEREGVHAVSGVPTTLMTLLESPAAAEHDLSSLGSFGAGGTAVPPELVRQVSGSFPTATMLNGYGLTETSSIATVNSGPEYLERPASVGRPTPVNEVQVVDEYAAPVPQGEIGEICIKGPNVIRGYWDNPEATQAAIVDGWFRSGDLGYLDEDGYLYVVDRAKDIVIRGGENVYCVEVEGRLVEHPEVMEAAVIGVPHARLGEEVGAVVRVRAGSSVDADELRAHVGETLAGFKVPAHLWIREEELPKTATGKILKRELKKELV